MKTLSVTISDETFAKFMRVQNSHGFPNQSDTLTALIEEIFQQGLDIDCPSCGSQYEGFLQYPIPHCPKCGKPIMEEKK